MYRTFALAMGVFAAVAVLASVAAPSDTGMAALARTDGEQVPAAKAQSPPLAALPPDAGSPQAFAFHPRRPDIVYVLTVSYPHGATRGHVYKTTDGGQHWHATATRGIGWTGDVLSLAADPRHPGPRQGPRHAGHEGARWPRRTQRWRLQRAQREGPGRRAQDQVRQPSPFLCVCVYCVSC